VTIVRLLSTIRLPNNTHPPLPVFLHHKSTSCLELELSEEVEGTDRGLVAGGLGVRKDLVPVLESLLDVAESGLLGLTLLRVKGVLGDSLAEGLRNVEGVASGHDVVQVDELGEGLDAHALLLLLVTHGLGDLPGGPLNTDNEGVGELAVTSALIEGLDDDGLAASEAAAEDNDDLAGLAANERKGAGVK
jgi:hypothetical protein